MAEAVENATSEQAPAAAPAEAAESVEVHQVELPQAAASATKAAPGQIDILLDTTMSISACLGEAEVQVRQLLQMGPGSVLKLDRRVGQPVDLYLRGIKFATGSLVVVGDQLGIRIKEILSPDPAKPAN